MTITISKEMADVLKEVVRVNMAIVHDELLYEQSGIDKIPGVKEARAKIATLEREIQVLGEAHRMLSEPEQSPIYVPPCESPGNYNRHTPPPKKKRRMGRVKVASLASTQSGVEAKTISGRGWLPTDRLATLNAALDDRVIRAEQLGTNDTLRDVLLGQADAIRKEIEDIEKAMPVSGTTNGDGAQTVHAQQTAVESRKSL